MALEELHNITIRFLRKMSRAGGETTDGITITIDGVVHHVRELDSLAAKLHPPEWHKIQAERDRQIARDGGG